jgi:glutaredoxin-related protein
VDAIKILEDSGHEYVLTMLDKSPDYRNQLKKKWKWDTVPIIITRDVNGQEELVGGCSDLKEYFSIDSNVEECEGECSID